MATLNKFLGTTKLPLKAQKILRLFIITQIIISFFIHLSSTFLILFAIDNLGFAKAGIMASIMLATQVLIDYPSGSLGDWLGQKWVLVSAYLSHAFAFLLLSLVNSFLVFIVIGIIIGFANAQASGALETWLDNNYKIGVGLEDQDRKIYGYSVSRVETLTIIPSVLAFILGGIFATIISRQFVFTVQIVLAILIAILIIFLINDITSDTNVELSSEERDKSYSSFLIGGITFLFSNKTVFFFIIGIAIYDLVLTIWSSLLLLPLFFAYTGSDIAISIMRTAIWIIIIPLHLYMATLSKKISNKRLSIAMAFHAFLLFSGWLVIITLIPIENQFNLLGMLGVMVVAISINGTLLAILMILRSRILLDIVPDQFRNSVYSLIPSLVALLGIPIIPIVGVIVELYGLESGIIISLVIAIIASICIFSSFIFKEKRFRPNISITKSGIN